MRENPWSTRIGGQSVLMETRYKPNSNSVSDYLERRVFMTDNRGHINSIGTDVLK